MAIVTKRDRITSKAKKQPIYYSDFLPQMETSAGSNELYKVTNDDSIKNALRNLILTNQGERLFNNDYGCNVRSLLFDHADPATESVMKSLIETSIKNFEPRVELIEVYVSAQDELNAFTATIIFSTINSTEPQTLDLILTRVR